MKNTKGIIAYSKILTLTLLTALGLFLNGCQQDSTVSGPVEDVTVDRATAVAASGKTIRFLGFGENVNQQFDKSTTKTKYIPKGQGGEFSLSQENNGLHVEFKLKVFPQTIDFTKTISMTFDDQNYEGFTDLVFGPHGTQFSSPAHLNMQAEGLDLSDVDPNNVTLYYVNDNGVWEEMVVESILIDVDDGKVKIKNAQIPHFSRYALAED